MSSLSRNKEVAFFFLIFAFVFGLVVRLYPVLGKDFPLVDGGMFYTMIEDLQGTNFFLPVFTTYNQSQIPYAYPPLSFYLAGWLNSVTDISIAKIIQWLPLVFNIFTIPIFYIFLKHILASEPRAALATLLYALTPNSYWWTIVGGGLTRSLGTFFFILSLFCVYKMYLERKPVWVIASTLTGTLVVLSHLTWAFQTVVAVMLLWVFFGRDKQSVIHSLIVALGVLLLTSPWWITVLSHHGTGAFSQAFQVNHSRWLAWTILFALSFTGEKTTVIAVFALVGLFIHLAKRNYFFAFWALLCLLSDPRGGTFASVFPFAALGMSAIADGVALQINGTSGKGSEAWTFALYSRAGKFFFGFFAILFFYGAYTVSAKLSQEVLSPGQREALEWIKKNTDARGTFIVLDEQGNPLLSPFVEWFPALSERHSLTTIQGTEWLEGAQHYNARMPIITKMRTCLAQDARCVIQSTNIVDVDYIVISSYSGIPLLLSLQNDPQFELMYQSTPVSIYKVRKYGADLKPATLLLSNFPEAFYILFTSCLDKIEGGL